MLFDNRTDRSTSRYLGMSFSRVFLITNAELRITNAEFQIRPTIRHSSFKFVIRHFRCGGNRIRTYEVIRQQIYSLSQLAALVFPRTIRKKELIFPALRVRLKKQECKIIRFSTFSKLKC